MDGISDVLQRVHGIEARLREMQAMSAAVSRGPASSVTPAAASAGDASFASVLAATATSTATSTSTSTATSTALPVGVGGVAATEVPGRAVVEAVPGTGRGAASAAGVSTPTLTPRTPPVVAASAVGGARDARGIPLELLRYGNGAIPASALAPVGQGQHRLWAPAARGFVALRAAAADAGVQVRVSDSYRSYDAQVDMARRKGLYSQGGLAAVPGTSEHGWGLSLDLDLDGKAVAWMREHANDYGFSENVAREPWHWTFTG